MNSDLTILIDKYLRGEATKSERELVDDWYRSFDSNPGLTEQLNTGEMAKAMRDSFAELSQKLVLPVADFKQGTV